MSSAVVSTSAALGRPFLFDAEPDLEACCVSGDKKPSGNQKSPIVQALQSTITPRQSAIPLVSPASRLEIRPLPEMVTSGIPALDALTGGLPRGCLTEICGSPSSGRTSVMLAALAAATRRGEYCALIDASDAFDAYSLSATRVDLDRLLWVRCSDQAPQKSPSKKNGYPISAAPFAAEAGISPPSFIVSNRNIPRSSESAFRQSEHRLEQVLRATDLLLESGGFGLIALDLADVPPQAARRIPLTTWFRFRRAVEHKPTILLTIEQQPIAGSCSSLLLQLEGPGTQYSVLSSNRNATDPATQDLKIPHAQLLTGLEINAELIRSRLDRKPARSMTFETKTSWAG